MSPSRHRCPALYQSTSAFTYVVRQLITIFTEERNGFRTAIGGIGLRQRRTK